MRGDPHGAIEGRSDTRNIKRSRQDDLAAHGVKLSHVTVRKIIAGRRIAA